MATPGLVTLEPGVEGGLAGGGGRHFRGMSRVTVDRLGKCFVVGRAKPIANGDGGVSKGKKRELWALRNVSFSLDAGSVLGVIGPNGAGKTTLLRILARTSLPTEGRVVGRGRVVSLLSIGMGMDADQTARENVFMEAALHRIPRLEAARRLDRIVEFAELGPFIDTPMRHYSSGMFTRLAFSVAVHMDPDLLLADEVLAVGDAAFQERCLERVKEAQGSGLTVVFVSHDMAAIRRIADRVLWLDRGRVAGLGPPNEIIDQYLSGAPPLSAVTGEGGDVDDQAVILGAEVVKNDEPGGEILTSHRFGVRVGIAVRSPAVREARYAISLSVGGIHVLRSVQPTPLVVSGPGTYAATVWIPPRLLTSTTYDVSVKVILSGERGVTRLVQDRALSLRVSDQEGNADKGLVAPPLEWTADPPVAVPSTPA
ncbi:MAG: polysaccharide ABC transporter ATP-binding protein [Candidatus Rokuibacteriota bacterium]